MTRTPAHALSRALAALEELREQALNEVARSLELVDIRQESDDERDKSADDP